MRIAFLISPLRAAQEESASSATAISASTHPAEHYLTALFTDEASVVDTEGVDVRRHPGDREALGRTHALAEIAPAAPIRVGHDRLPPDLVERDVLRGMARRRGDR